MSLENSVMKEWAMKYAALGFAVFPLKPHNKVPATSDGFKSATTDPQQINAWWDGNPLYNIGIATGAVSRGLLVLDLDEDDKNNKHGPEEARKWLAQRKTDFPKTATVRTGRGGIHMFYYGQGRNRSNLLPGVDVRGEGGYIVAPPSIHPNGNTYIKLIGSLKAKGLSDEAIQAAVRAENEKCCSPPSQIGIWKNRYSQPFIEAGERNGHTGQGIVQKPGAFREAKITAWIWQLWIKWRKNSRNG